MFDLPFESLREAIAIFVRIAYPSGDLPEAVKKRIALDARRPVAELLDALNFERYVADGSTVYALRLGSVHYPHLKMEIRAYPGRSGFVFWVNTHDQFFTPDPRCRDVDRWRELVQRNRELKEAIEHAWAERGLPTFATEMRESLATAETR